MSTQQNRLHPVADGLGRRPSQIVVPPPGEGPGFWAGGPSAVWSDGAVWLAYRLRRPVDAGRGYANVVARSVDGYSFETVAEITSSQFDCASLERPALACGGTGDWRLYVSCSTFGSKHWWVEMIEGPSPEAFGSGRGLVVLPGDAETAWKDPVVAFDANSWHMWACRHHIEPPEEADRMESWHAISPDGRSWALDGPALVPTPGTWDQRGARITSVLRSPEGDGLSALYDGRASADENWLERTGIALGSSPSRFDAVPDGPLVEAPSLRYVSAVELPDGGWMVYYEAERADGAHDLRVEYVPRP